MSISQLFTYEISNDSKELVDKAKKDIAECASEMGFTYTHEFKVVPFKCKDTGVSKWRVDAEFHA